MIDTDFPVCIDNKLYCHVSGGFGNRFWEGIKVIRHEGMRASNLFSVLLCGYLAVWPMIGNQGKNALHNALCNHQFVVGVCIVVDSHVLFPCQTQIITMKIPEINLAPAYSAVSSGVCGYFYFNGFRPGKAAHGFQ